MTSANTPNSQDQNQPTTPPPTADVTPEVQREMREMWERKLNLSSGTLSADTRKNLTKILGRSQLGSIEKKRGILRRRSVVDAEAQRMILDKVLETRAGLYQYIKPKDYKKTQLVITNPSGATVRRNMTSLVSDPASREAQALAWIFENYVGSTNRATVSEIFYPVEESHLKDAQAMLKMQDAYKKLIEDEENMDIGTLDPSPDLGQVDPPSTSKGFPTIVRRPSCGRAKGRLKRLQQRQLENQQQAEFQRLIPKGKGNPTMYDDRINKAEDDIRTLEKKQQLLKKELTNMNTLSKGLSTSVDFSGDIPALSEDFSSTTLSSRLGTSIRVGTATKTVAEWMEDKELKSTQSDLVDRYRFVGTGAIPANLALKALMKKLYGARLYGLDQAAQDRFYAEMQRMILSSEGAQQTQDSRIETENGTASSAGAGGSTAQGATVPLGKRVARVAKRTAVLGLKTGAVGLAGGALGATALSLSAGGIAVGAGAAITGYLAYRTIRAGAKAAGKSKFAKRLYAYMKEPMNPLGGRTGGGGSSGHN